MPKTRPRRARTRRELLNREVVIEAALAEIDEHGVAGFSLRGLSDRLGVYPTAVYWHVPTKDHIFAEVVGALFRDVAPTRASRDWRNDYRQLFLRFRASVRRHPKVAPLVGAHLVGNLSIEFAFVEGVLGVLTRAGIAGPTLVWAYNATIAALVGFVVQEFSPLPNDSHPWQSAVKSRLLDLDAVKYPVLAANLPQLADKAFIVRWHNGVEAPLNESFEAFVEQALAGIESLTRSPKK